MEFKTISHVVMVLVGIALGSLCIFFPSYYILAAVIITILFLLQLNHKYLLLLLLIIGFVLFDRSFAHLGIEIGGLPLYITEAVLFATIGILLLDRLVGRKVNYLKNIPLKKEFAFFYLIGFVALIRGFLYYTPLLTLRHAALFYYSIFYFLMPVLFKDLRRIKLLFRLFFVASIVISVATLLKINLQFNIYGKLGNFNYLYLSLVVIVEFFYFVSLKKRVYKILLLLIIFLQLSVLLVGRVSGAWVAFLVSMLFFLYLSSKMDKLKRRMRMVFLSVVAVGVILFTLAILINPASVNKVKSEAVSTVFFYRVSPSHLEFQKYNPIYLPSYTTANNVWWRLFIWRDMLKELFKKPLFGWGFGRPFRSPTLESLGWGAGEEDGWIDPHNSHLNIAYKSGIIGYVIFLLIIASFFKKTIRLLLRMRKDDKIKLYIGGLLTCVVNILVLSFFEVVLEGPFMGSFLWISMGLIVALENIYNRKRSEF